MPGSRASPATAAAAASGGISSLPGLAQERKPHKPSTAALDSAAYGATGLKNFGNTCFMNCVIQCLVGTGPFCRYFLQGNWKKDLVRDSKKSYSEVAIEFARLVDNMWRGQYGSLSPIGFRSAVGNCSAQFKGNDQEDAQEFASFLLDALHESLNRVHPQPSPDRDLTAEEEHQFEKLPDWQQANIQWERYIRRNWSIMTSIFQGQIQSRLTCLSCNNTSTTYYTFTELSVPIPSANSSSSKQGAATTLLRKSAGRNGSTPAPVSIYQCLNAFSEIETLDGENKWKCPRCKAKRRATKRLLVSRLPLVLIVHLKRFSTIGHFREKLETNVVFPTQQLQMDPYVIGDVRHQSPTGYNLYAVANHYGTLSAGHYTASVFNGLRGQWNYFDDTRVSPVAEDKVATPAAYLLFYVQNHSQG
ncbi:ubiquitin-specific protease doa4 [Coemansia asiatica]|nr:ubiquitin-specific protease doa4 [Coemansia asiatica]